MRVGRYELVRLLGEGGMGSVHEAVHVVTERRVAVKLLRPEVVAVPGALDRFRTEARAACRVEHPHVVDVLDVAVDDGTAYMVLELLHGESLEERLERGPVTVDELWGIAEPLLAALDKAHARGIVHRDLKPANIFLSTDAAGQLVPKLLDFGIAKLLGADELSLTSTGQLVGTPLYMPPEIIGGQKATGPASDIYSFAAVCYEALSGEPPFRGDTLPQLLLLAIESDPPPLEERGVPSVVADVIAKGMARDPAARFESAAAFARALRAAVRDGDQGVGLAATALSVEPPPDHDPPVGGWGARRWVAAAAILVAVAGAAYVGMRDPNPPEPTAAPIAEPATAGRPIVEPPPPASSPNPVAPSNAAAASVAVGDPMPEGVDAPGAEPSPRPAEASQASAVERPRAATREARSPVPQEPAVESSAPQGGGDGADPLRVEGARTGGLSADEF